MRHVVGFILAIALAAAVFFGGAWGYVKLLRVPVANAATSALPGGGGSLIHDRTTLVAFAALAGVALLAGILVATPWVSPLATLLPALGFIGLTAWYMVNVQQVVNIIEKAPQTYATGMEGLLFNGVLAVLGVVLLIPAFVPSRWTGYLDDSEDPSGLLSDFNTTTAV